MSKTIFKKDDVVRIVKTDGSLALCDNIKVGDHATVYEADSPNSVWILKGNRIYVVREHEIEFV